MAVSLRKVLSASVREVYLAEAAHNTVPYLAAELVRFPASEYGKLIRLSDWNSGSDRHCFDGDRVTSIIYELASGFFVVFLLLSLFFVPTLVVGNNTDIKDADIVALDGREGLMPR